MQQTYFNNLKSTSSSSDTNARATHFPLIQAVYNSKRKMCSIGGRKAENVMCLRFNFGSFCGRKNSRFRLLTPAKSDRRKQEKTIRRKFKFFKCIK